MPDIETQGEPADADYRATVCAVGEPAQRDANKPDRSGASSRIVEEERHGLGAGL